MYLDINRKESMMPKIETVTAWAWEIFDDGGWHLYDKRTYPTKRECDDAPGPLPPCRLVCVRIVRNRDWLKMKKGKP